MGNNSSLAEAGSRLAKQDVARLQRRFSRLAGPDALVSIEQLQGIVELGANPFVGRIFQLFDSDGDHKLSQQDFTQALTYFGTLDQAEEQYKFAFRLYDVDGDGFVGGTDLYNTLSALSGRSHSDAQMEQVVHNTLLHFDEDGDNKLSMEEFKALLASSSL
ncbi:hypothetical protein V8C86DRAFT_2655463 [Haematococcus lacustris]